MLSEHGGRSVDQPKSKVAPVKPLVCRSVAAEEGPPKCRQKLRQGGPTYRLADRLKCYS
jgi:hypothetical protein